MTTGEVLYIGVAFLVAMGICTLPALGSLRGAGARYRAEVLRQLAVGWGVAVLGAGWLVLGWFALDGGTRLWGTYRDFTLVLMGAFFPLLVVGIRAGNRAAAAAQRADQTPASAGA